MKRMIDLYRSYKELIDYLFWGVMTTVVSWASYSIFVILFADFTAELRLFGLDMSGVVLVANVLSWVCAFSFAFFANKLWVFQSKSWQKDVWLSEFGKFFSARVVTGVMEIVAVPLLVSLGLHQSVFGVEGMVAKVIVSIAVVILNYIFSKLFIFKPQGE